MRNISLVALLFLLLATPLGYNTIRGQELTNEVRATLEHKTFVSLSDGVTHYQWAGPKSGPRIILVHGFSSPCFVWDKAFESLAQAGYRVLRYDLYGRGLSDRPDKDYTADLFVRQLDELLTALQVDTAVDIIGLSMGGAITAHFIDQHPKRVNNVVLLAPAGLNDLPAPSVLLQVPFLGEWLMDTFGGFIIHEIIPRQIAKPEARDAFRTAYIEQDSFRGYRRALLSTLRHGPLTQQEEVFKRIAKHTRNGLLIWGVQDSVVSFQLHQELLEILPWLQLHAVPNAGHSAVYDQYQDIEAPLLNFLDKHHANTFQSRIARGDMIE